MPPTSSELDHRLSALAGSVRSYDAVVVIGAGFSAFGYPMTAQLPALLWQAIAKVDGASEELAARAGRGGTPKEILGEDPATVALGWDLVRCNPAVREAFQKAFTSLDADRDPSPGHRALARLIHDGRVGQVISYNWDSCLERAYQDLYGTPLPDRVLFKPHGDVQQPEEEWTLPDEDGLVPDSVQERLVELDNRPRTLISLGYSASDPTVVEKLLTPLQNKWPVYQVSPSAKGADAVPATADEAMAYLVDHVLDTTSSGWRSVTFNTHRDLLAALRGERLRPIDVLECPELPYAAALAERLRTAHFASLSGDSGTGKSITGFHAARRVHRDGWEVVELTRPGVAGPDEVRQLKAMFGRVLAVVDDAQAIDPSTVADLRDCVDDTHAVLLISTDRLETHNDEVVSAQRAKQAIYQHLLAHLDTVGTQLTLLDDRVGDGMTQELPRRRLEAANASAQDPWAFMFVASGGDRRIHSTLDRLVDEQAPAVVLGVVALNQMTSQDAGVTADVVIADVASCAPELFGVVDGQIDTNRFSQAIEVAQQERMVRDHNGLLRSPHIRVADRITKELAKSSDPVVGPAILTLVRSHLRRPDLPLRGKYWVVSALERSDALRYQLIDQWLDNDTAEVLVAQSLEASPGRDRLVALNLLWELGFVDVLDREQWERVVSQATTWLPEMDAMEVYGFRWFLGGVRSRQDDLYEQIRGSMPAAEVGAMLATRATRPSASAWAEVIRELEPKYEAPNLESWRTDFLLGLDLDALAGWVRDVGPDSHNDDIYDLLDVLAEMCPKAATVVLQASAEQLRSSFETDLVDASHGFTRWAFGHMLLIAMIARSPAGLRPSDLDDDNDEERQDQDGQPVPEAAEATNEELWIPSDDQVELASATLELMSSVDWAAAGSSLRGHRLYDLQSLDLLFFWLGRLSMELLDHLSVAVAYSWLDEVATQTTPPVPVDDAQTGEPPQVANIDKVSSVLANMTAGDRGLQHVRGYVEQRLDSLEGLPFHLIEALPDLAAGLVRAGRAVLLEDPRARGWLSNSRALRAVRDVDRSAAEVMLRASTARLTDALAAPQSNDLQGLPTFIQDVDDLDPSILDLIIAGLDAATCEGAWRARLEDQPYETGLLLERAARLDGVVGQVARGLIIR